MHSMTRLIPLLCLLASTAMADVPIPIYPAPQPPPPGIVTQINERMKELYNARDFTKLARELYTDNANLDITKYGIKAHGPPEIEALLRKRAVGKMQKITILNVSQDKSAYFVVALISFGKPDGSSVVYRLTEIIENGKFSKIIQQ